MEQLKRMLITCLLLASIATPVNASSATAPANPSDQSPMTIHEIYRPQGEGTSSSNNISPMQIKGDLRYCNKTKDTGSWFLRIVEHECKYETHRTMGSKLVKYDSKPMTNQVMLISVAKGQSQRLTSSVTQSKTIEVSQSVSASIFEVISSSLTQTETGTISKTYEVSTEYTGPDPSSPYNSRDYYSAVGYDQNEITIGYGDIITQRVEVYMNNKLKKSSEVVKSTHDSPFHSIFTVQVPKILTYSVDVNRQ
ncbi:hypothetical protein [Paenibacillus sp. 481]|uniref:hypothetical protein n=1 Tax=Paenibacillus sp. 481 TaxID=2835869 RepID=UPI001E3B1C6D|nr:hypothetical protein [Paenibacillus sp. 481]UHA75128.1 hypothetical protein KIK04_08945 [Paenibacillus sp. 481]